MNQLTKILLEDILEIKNQDYIIYFDIDDTLTDYSNRLGSMIITDPETGEKRPIKVSDTVDNKEFWTTAKWLPGSKEMLDFAKNNFSNVEILSAVPELSKANKELTGKIFFDDPIDGKTEWLNKNVGPIKTIWTKSGKEKAIYATPNTVLIDDKPNNIKAFEQAGGIGILMDNSQNVINKLSDLLEGKNIVQEGIMVTDLQETSKLVFEGRYDSLTRTVVKDIMADWKSQFDGYEGILTFEEDYENELVNFELYAVLNVKETKYGLYKVDGGADPLRNPAYLEVKFTVDPRDLPQKWEEIYMDLTDVVRHEIEHMTQQGPNVVASTTTYKNKKGEEVTRINSKEMADDQLIRNLIKLKLLPKAEYYKLEQEVDAMLQGMYLKAKKSKLPFKDVIDAYFDKARISKKDRKDILDLWKQRSKALSLPLNELEEGKQVGPLYHYTSANGLKSILQSNRINASEENYLGNKLYYISFTRNQNFHKKGSKFGVKTEYRITLDGDKLSNKYKIRPFAYVPGWDIEDSWELDWLDDEPESVRRDFFNATGDYDEQEERIFFKNENGGIDNIKNYILAVDKVEDIQEKKNKDPFGLNELAKDFVKEVFEETWNPQEAFLSLAVFMKDNGMNITPLPKIKVIPDDKENASHLLGKTAHYNPAEKLITLYTFKRHPKDVLRSFAHEMVHHEQNLDGTLGNINTTNTNEDGHLKDIEKEAYQKGNIMFRNWEDSVKNV